jgi:hypothetical protein
MTPGLPGQAVMIAAEVGSVTNHGDGVYGGMFVACMYSAAYFESEPRRIVEAGMECLPAGSEYREAISDTVAAFDANPDDWRAAWQVVEKAWNRDDACPDGALTPCNYGARLNGAYAAIGLLYGEGGFERSLEIAARCGQGAAGNASSAGGVIGVVHGLSGLEQKWGRWVENVAQVEEIEFQHTNYTFGGFVESTRRRILQTVTTGGGVVTGDGIRVEPQRPSPPELEEWPAGVPAESIGFRDPRWQWKGRWTFQNGAGWWHPAGMVSNSGGNEAYLEFEGTGIALAGDNWDRGLESRHAGGRVAVLIDGVEMAVVDAYRSARTYDSDLWHVFGLDEGRHSLRLVTQDEPSRQSRGNQILVQRAIVFRD